VFEWLARSGYRSAEKPDFELYHPGAQPLSPDEGIEIWLGIVDRGLPSGSIEVRSASPADSDAWLQMRVALWPDGDGRLADDPAGAPLPAEWHAQEIEQFFTGRLSMPLEVLIAFGPDGAALGFAELSIRPYAEGCTTDKVAYLEGWYVQPQARRRGVGRALIDAAERWAVARGCTEFASDALLENHVSAAAHEALGFEEVDQIRCFRKDLRGR
jgi:aminoglycoside 6'-N-acetyltransferase I